MADAQTLRSAVSSRGLDDILAYACSLHASTDFREKLYKVFQSALKLPGAGPNARKAAATLSQSRGIFKLLKCVNNIETYRKALSEDDAVLRGLQKTEACLNSLVGVMQDAISLDKLFSTKLVSERFAWWMNFLDLLLSLLLAGLAAHALRLLRLGGTDVATAKARRKALLLRLEIAVRLGDAVALLEATSHMPGSKRRLWPAPSPHTTVLANLISACCASSAVGLKKWAALPPPPTAPVCGDGAARKDGIERQQQPDDVVDLRGGDVGRTKVKRG